MPNHEKPTVGRIVHYVARGPGDTMQHFAAIVTQAGDDYGAGLAVFHPEHRTIYLDNVMADFTQNQIDTWHWPERTDAA